MSYRYDAKGDFSGFIEVGFPNLDERMDLAERVQVVNDGEGSDSLKNIRSARVLLSWSRGYFKTVDVSHSDGSRYSSFLELSQDPRCRDMLIEVCTGISNGFKPDLGN